jgi:hypothetical protein
MKTPLFGLCLAAWFTMAQGAWSETNNTYQVTGPVVELTPAKIVVQKNDEKWEIARDAHTKVQGDLKVGTKVTIQYRMTATKIDARSSASTEKK